MPMVTSSFACSGWLMYEKKSYTAALTSSELAALTAPDQPPNAENGAWLMPSTACGQRSASQSTSSPVSRSSTWLEPGRITAPTLSWTLEVAGSIASVPMSPQSSDSAQRPLVNRPRVSPTSRLISSGGPYLVVST